MREFPSPNFENPYQEQWEEAERIRAATAKGAAEGIAAVWAAHQAWQEQQAREQWLASLPAVVRAEYVGHSRRLKLHVVIMFASFIVGSVIAFQISPILASISILGGIIICPALTAIFLTRPERAAHKRRLEEAWNWYLKLNGTSLEEVREYHRAEMNRQQAYAQAQRQAELDHMRDVIDRWS